MSKFQFQTIAFGPKTVPTIKSAKAQRLDNVRRRKPRILMVGMHLTKTRGGITTLTANILDSSLAEKYDFTYIESQAEDLGVVRKVLLAVGAGLRFASICVWKRPDVVYVHVGSNASLYRESAFILLAKFFGLRVISHFHAGDVSTYMPVQPRLGRSFIRRALGCSDKMIAVSAESAGYLRKMLPGANMSVLPNAIDLRWLDSPEKSVAGDKNDKRIRLLFVGAVGKLKGENDLINALALLKRRGLDVRASFVGYGADQLADACSRIGVDHMIEHLGPVPMNERAAFFHRADIFVLPTYAEAMPVSVMEAMAAGLPVVTTPVGGIPEIIEDGKEGILYPCGDVAALAESIARLVVDQAARSRMGELARKRVSEQMNFDKYISGLKCEIEQVREGNP